MTVLSRLSGCSATGAGESSAVSSHSRSLQPPSRALEPVGVDLTKLICKFCGRCACDVGWARQNEGNECTDCRCLLRRALVGSRDEKKAKKSQVEAECRTEQGREHYVETSLNRWLAMSESERGGAGSKKDFRLTPLETCLSKVCTDGLVMQEVMGIMWPKAIFESVKKQIVHPDDLQTIRGIAGVVLPEVPGEILPRGVFRIFNESKDLAERRDLIESSNNAASKLLEGQIDRAAESLATQARGEVGQTMDLKEAADGKLVPVSKPKETPADDKEQAKKKRKIVKKVAADSDDCSSDDWFIGVPKGQDKDESRQPARRQPATRVPGGRRPPGAAHGSGGGRSGASKGSGNKTAADAAGLGWRDRQTKCRKVKQKGCIYGKHVPSCRGGFAAVPGWRQHERQGHLHPSLHQKGACAHGRCKVA